MEISNSTDAEFKTLVIRMLKELIGYFNSIKKTQAEIKVTLSEINKNLQGTTVEGMKLRLKLMIWNIRKKNIQSEQQEEKRIQKFKTRIRSLWGISKLTNIRIIGMPE